MHGGFRKARRDSLVAPLRKSVERGSLLDTPSYRWIGARQRIKQEFTVFLSEIPEGFAGVTDVRLEHGVPIVSTR